MRCAVVLAFLLGGAGCDEGAGARRLKCSGDSDQGTCHQGDACVWLQVEGGAGYFCATLCSAQAPCGDGRACKEDQASGCQTCDNLLSVCE